MYRRYTLLTIESNFGVETRYYEIEALAEINTKDLLLKLIREASILRIRK
jgi:hypothetical protein